MLPILTHLTHIILFVRRVTVGAQSRTYGTKRFAKVLVLCVIISSCYCYYYYYYYNYYYE